MQQAPYEPALESHALHGRKYAFHEAAAASLQNRNLRPKRRHAFVALPTPKAFDGIHAIHAVTSRS